MTHTKDEALELALEALEFSTHWDLNATGRQLKSMQAIIRLRKALAQGETSSPMAAQEPVAWPTLTTDEREALERFNETCEDDQDYDVPKPMMKRLSAIGVVYSAGFGRYGLTEFGRAALAQPEERNFCSRCGKRTADLTVIHTCTPPQENT